MDHPKNKLLKPSIRSIIAAVVLGVIAAVAVYIFQNNPAAPASVRSPHPVLGIKYHYVSEGVANVQEVATASAAEKAGLRIGDVITGIDGQKINSANKISQVISAKKAGDKLSLTILLEGREKTITAILQ